MAKYINNIKSASGKWTDPMKMAYYNNSATPIRIMTINGEEYTTFASYSNTPFGYQNVTNPDADGIASVIKVNGSSSATQYTNQSLYLSGYGSNFMFQPTGNYSLEITSGSASNISISSIGLVGKTDDTTGEYLPNSTLWVNIQTTGTNSQVFQGNLVVNLFSMGRLYQSYTLPSQRIPLNIQRIFSGGGGGGGNEPYKPYDDYPCRGILIMLPEYALVDGNYNEELEVDVPIPNVIKEYLEDNGFTISYDGEDSLSCVLITGNDDPLESQEIQSLMSGTYDINNKVVILWLPSYVDTDSFSTLRNIVTSLQSYGAQLVICNPDVDNNTLQGEFNGEIHAATFGPSVDGAMMTTDAAVNLQTMSGGGSYAEIVENQYMYGGWGRGTYQYYGENSGAIGEFANDGNLTCRVFSDYNYYADYTITTAASEMSTDYSILLSLLGPNPLMRIDMSAFEFIDIAENGAVVLWSTYATNYDMSCIDAMSRLSSSDCWGAWYPDLDEFSSMIGGMILSIENKGEPYDVASTNLAATNGVFISNGHNA